jgi:hypothetical protein
LIIADPQQVTFVCRCGRRSLHRGLSLQDVIGLVEAEPMHPQWSDVEEAVRALGFAPAARTSLLRELLPHRRPRPRLIAPGAPDVGRD